LAALDGEVKALNDLYFDNKSADLNKHLWKKTVDKSVATDAEIAEFISERDDY